MFFGGKTGRIGSFGKKEDKDMFEQVKAFFVEKTGVPANEICPETELTELGMDSMSLIMVINDFEDAFGVSISDRELENLHTVGDIAKLVER